MAGDALRVLIVCAANQCRSRAAEVLLAKALQDSPGIEIISAGVEVEAPLRICAKAEKFLENQGFFAADPERPARALTPQLLEQAHLVLVADKLVRAKVVAMDAKARSKTFSLRGAGAAARYINTNDLVARARAAHRRGESAVTDLVDSEEVLVCTALADGLVATTDWLLTELEAAQGHAAPGGQDVDDAHVVLRAKHTTALHQIFEACQPLADLLRSLNHHSTNK